MENNTDYYNKYLKYKSKYLQLINSNQSGGESRKKRTQTWKQKEKSRQLELENVKSTKSFIPKTKLTSRNKIYYIHDNGGRPFKVTANSLGIEIGIRNSDNKEDYDSKFTIKKFEGFWSGFDSSPYEKSGNSILIKINDNEYIYIGSEIYQFSTSDIIVDYVSYLGNNDVPYPVAYGENNIYFMLDKKYIKISDLSTPITIANSNNLYQEFYSYYKKKDAPYINMKKVKILQIRLY